MIGGLQFLRKDRLSAAVAHEVLTKADRDEVVQRIERAIDGQERRIADAFRESIAQIRDVATLEDIAERIEAGDIDGVERLLNEQEVTNGLQPLEAAIAGAAFEGGRVAADSLEPVRGPNGNQVNFVFNQSNPRISEFARQISAQRVREVSDDVRAVVREIVREETVAGRNPRDAARRIRESVGLTARQERTVQNFRRNLEMAAEGNTQAAREARSLELRDKRFSIRQGMTQEQVDRQVARFRQRYINHRAEVIGRTEATRALNGARQELMQTYVDNGQISEQQVRRFWRTARDERVRSSHRQIPAMNEDGVGLNETFDTPLGPLRYPGDPRGIAQNTVQCRCVVFDRVISAELLEDQ